MKICFGIKYGPQAGKLSAAAVIKTLSEQLQREFGKGFSVSNIEQMRLFYLEYPITQTLSAQLDAVENSASNSGKLEFSPAAARLRLAACV